NIQYVNGFQARRAVAGCAAAASAAGHPYAVFDSRAALIGVDDGAVVRGDAVEVAVDDRHHRFAREFRVAGHRFVRRRIRGQVVDIEQIRAGAVEADVGLTADDPFGFRDFLVFDFDADRCDVGGLPLFDDAVIRGLSGDGVKV